MRELSKTEIAVIISTAKSIQPFLVKEQKLKKDLEEINAKLEANAQQIEVFENFICNMTGGYGSRDLVTVQKKQTGERDGKPVFINEYIFHEPDTPSVPQEDNTPLEDLLN